MKAFMDKDFLLSTETAQELYHEFAAQVPVLDYHCHINPQEIAEDRKFENITQVWLGGDHYKWRQMRSNGVDEYYITGDAPDREKFQKWAETLEKAIGNPLFHWSHLELQRFFGYNGVLNSETAEEVWNLCNAKLQEDSMSVRNLIKQSNVTLICTTDDPIDDLKWHKIIKEDDSFDVQVLPAWRPDKAMNLEKPEYLDYIGKLAAVSGVEIKTFADLKAAIKNRMEFLQEKQFPKKLPQNSRLRSCSLSHRNTPALAGLCSFTTDAKETTTSPCMQSWDRILDTTASAIIHRLTSWLIS